jgi:hypothetical protein
MLVWPPCAADVTSADGPANTSQATAATMVALSAGLILENTRDRIISIPLTIDRTGGHT